MPTEAIPLEARIPEANVVLLFLRAELGSPRYKALALRKLRGWGDGEGLVARANLQDAGENAARRELLEVITRHDGPVGLFDGFPRDMEWWTARPSVERLLHTHYVNLPAWTWFSRGTRRLEDGARTVFEYNGSLGNIPVDAFWQAAQRCINYPVPGVDPPDPSVILVAQRPTDDFPVIFDGHLRLTGWALAQLIGARDVRRPTVIIGLAPNLHGWKLY